MTGFDAYVLLAVFLAASTHVDREMRGFWSAFTFINAIGIIWHLAFFTESYYFVYYVATSCALAIYATRFKVREAAFLGLAQGLDALAYMAYGRAYLLPGVAFRPYADAMEFTVGCAHAVTCGIILARWTQVLTADEAT